MNWILVLLSVVCSCHIISAQSDGDSYSGLGFLKPRVEERIRECTLIWFIRCQANGHSQPTGRCQCVPYLDLSSEAVQTVRLGGTVTLYCVFSGYPLPTISWRGPQNSLPAGRHTKTNWDTTLILNGLTASDEGNYSCSASNSNGQSGVKTLQLRIESSDVDECAARTSGCDQVCHNSIGSYRCDCRSGYSLARNGLSCNDVDECASGTSGCHQACTNSIGSYACGCNPGFSLAQNGKSCNDVDECALGTSGCAQLCINSIGSYTCDCNQGYSVAQNGKSCNPKPEFRNKTDGPYNVTVTEGETVTLSCNPFANPEANIAWLQNGHPIDVDNPPERFMFSNDKKSLTIRYVCRDCINQETKTDQTVIQCNASNIHGNTIATGYINVLIKTKVTIKGPKEVSVDFLEEKQFVFQCIATSDASTHPTVRWYKTLPYGDLVRDEPPYVNVTNEFLIITITPNCSDECVKHLGEYRCVGDNGYSQDNQTITLQYVSRLSTETDGREDGTWAAWKIGLVVGAALLGLLLVGIFLGRRSKRRSNGVPL